MSARRGPPGSSGGPPPREPAALRRCVLAVAVLHDVDLVPCAEGVVLTSDPRRPADGPLVTWAEVDEAVGIDEPDSSTARARVARWFRLRRTVASLPAEALSARARVLGLPRAHVLHPGSDWVAERVPGGTLDLGLGMVGVGGDYDTVQPVPARLLGRLGADPAAWWPTARAHLEQAGSRAAERLTEERPVLRSIGPADVVSLLGSAAFRAALTTGSGGMRAVAVPMRTRGWTDLRRIDPAFVLAAAAAVDPEDAGFPRPLLVTRDEVRMVPPGGDPLKSALEDRR